MHSSPYLTTSLIIQYSIVGIVLLAICIWIFWKIFKKNKNTNNSCCGCALSEGCSKKDLKIKINKIQDKTPCNGSSQNLQ